MTTELKLNALGIAENWSVTVEVEGERVLCISNQHYAGVSNLERYVPTIENCAKHLLAFIGASAMAESEPSKAEPFCYVAITGHGKHYRESLEGLSSEVRSLWKPLYDHPTPPAPDVSKSAVEIDMEKEREEFEKDVIWRIGDDPSLLYRRTMPGAMFYGEYVNEKIQRHWLGWQARALLAAKGGE